MAGEGGIWETIYLEFIHHSGVRVIQGSGTDTGSGPEIYPKRRKDTQNSSLGPLVGETSI